MMAESKGPNKTDKMKVLFLCIHNSARSQMAEGLLRAMYGDRYEAYSAGVEATSVDPYALKVMGEIGIDISGHRSKGLEEFRGILFDIAVTLCDDVEAMCPISGTTLRPALSAPMAKAITMKGFKCPAAAKGSEEEKLAIFRQVRDEIKNWIIQTFG